MGEIWKDIPQYEGIYQASNLGRIKSLKRIAKKEYKGNRVVKEKIMRGTPNEDGYLKVHFKIKEKNINKVLFIHRLVAQTFISNPDNLPQVNHKDGNKKNNNINNLEWCTNLYNQKHAWENSLHKPTKKEGRLINQYDKSNKFIKSYKSISEASRKTKINPSNICMAAKKERKTAGGYIWTY